MLKYGKNINFDPKRLDPLNIDRQSIELIPNNSKVLEIGCATGFMGKYLRREKHCYVVGIEKGIDEVKEAKKSLNKVIDGDVEEKIILARIGGKFDVVLASAVIEHLKDPWGALISWKKFLKKDGYLIITTSNIAHWSIRLQLLMGKFNYQEYGILDNTHLHFFTTETFKKLVKDCGYKIEYFSIDPVGGGLPKVSKVLSRFWPNLFAYQMLIKASPLHTNSSE